VRLAIRVMKRKEFWLIHGCDIREVSLRGLKEFDAGKVLVKSTGLPSQWDWEQIKAWL